MQELPQQLQCSLLQKGLLRCGTRANRLHHAACQAWFQVLRWWSILAVSSQVWEAYSGESPCAISLHEQLVLWLVVIFNKARLSCVEYRTELSTRLGRSVSGTGLRRTCTYQAKH